MKKKIVLLTVVLLLTVTIAALCAGCTPGIDAVANKFSNRGYTVVKTDTQVTAAIPDENSITITWYDDGDEAQAAYDNALQIYTEKNVAKKGNAVAVGDEKSINIFK